MRIEKHHNTSGVNPIVDQIVGTMALSGMDLSQEDRERILHLLDHPDNEETMLQVLLTKHTRKEPGNE